MDTFYLYKILIILKTVRKCEQNENNLSLKSLKRFNLFLVLKKKVYNNQPEHLWKPNYSDETAFMYYIKNKQMKTNEILWMQIHLYCITIDQRSAKSLEQVASFKIVTVQFVSLGVVISNQRWISREGCNPAGKITKK